MEIKTASTFFVAALLISHLHATQEHGPVPMEEDGAVTWDMVAVRLGEIKQVVAGLEREVKEIVTQHYTKLHAERYWKCEKLKLSQLDQSNKLTGLDYEKFLDNFKCQLSDFKYSDIDLLTCVDVVSKFDQVGLLDKSFAAARLHRKFDEIFGYENIFCRSLEYKSSYTYFLKNIRILTKTHTPLLRVVNNRRRLALFEVIRENVAFYKKANSNI